MTVPPRVMDDSEKSVTIQVNDETVNGILRGNALSFSAYVPESRILNIRLPDDFPVGPVTVLICYPDKTDKD